MAEGRETHCCTFRLAGHLFGLDILAVREVSTVAAFTPVPQAPPEVRGLVNLRGHIFLVLDLGLLLGLGPAPVTDDSRLLIFKPSVGASFGVLVDRVGEIVTLTAAQTEDRQPEAGGAGPAGALVAGVARLQGELLVLVNPHRLPGVVGERVQEYRSSGRSGAG